MRIVQMGRIAFALVVAALLLGGGVPAAQATVSVGACCLANGQCQSVTQFDCDALNGDFIGVDTSCVMIECPSLTVGAPVLSIVGLVAGLGALVGLGLYRLLPRRTA